MKSTPSILIIEDDTWFAEQNIRTLSSAGFSVRHAANGLAGMEAIDALTPDVIILDMFLPGPNALVLLHELQSHTDLSNIPVIICTNSSSAIPVGTLQAYGVNQVLDKGTMEPNDLIAAIRRVVL